MGRDKALIEFESETLLARALHRFGTGFERLLVSVGPDGPTSEVEAVVASARDTGLRVDFVLDRRPPQTGPLAALESVLEALEGESVFLLAVDCPFVSLDFARSLCEAHAARGVRASIPAWSKGVEPSVAVYRRDLGADISRRIDEGERRLRSLIDLPGVETLDVETWDDVDPASLFRNWNSPDDVS